MPKLSKTSVGVFQRRKPLVKVPAKYPRVALKRGLIGSATIAYIVGKDGRVKYPVIDRATSEDFVESSINATKSFIYEPAKIDGEPVVTFGVKNRFIYELSKNNKIKHDRLYNALIDLREKADNGSSVDRYKYAKTASVIRPYIDSERQEEFEDTTFYFSKAAIDGLPQAKYELGKSILYGEQCHSDFDSSYFWLSEAAEDGLPEAQMMLGLERLYGVRFDGNDEHGLELLELAAKNYDPAKLELAIALVESDQGNKDSLQKAKELVDAVDVRSFEDKVSLYEAQVLVFSVLGEGQVKDKALKKLEKEAKKLKLPFDLLAQNINRRLVGEEVLPLVPLKS